MYVCLYVYVFCLEESENLIHLLSTRVSLHPSIGLWPGERIFVLTILNVMVQTSIKVLCWLIFVLP